VGRTAYSAKRQSYPEPLLCLLIRQCKEREHTSSGITYPKAYSRRDEILREMAKLKSAEMGTVEVKKALRGTVLNSGLCANIFKSANL
jgi:hypothetical protein